MAIKCVRWWSCVSCLTLALAGGSAWAEGEAVLENGVLTFNVDAATYPEETPYAYTGSLTADITSVIKRGTGTVDLGTPASVAAFKGTIEVEANGGYLAGNVKAFGVPTSITVRNGGAVKFTETAKVGTMAGTHFMIAGAGPDGKGALIRPNANPGTAHDFFGYIELLEDATINTGSRWGLVGWLFMGNHTLTLRNDRHVATGWGSDWVCFDFSYTITIKDPGAIVVESGILSFQMMGTAQPTFLDHKDSNGTISNMTITVKGDSGSRVRIMGIKKGRIPFHLVTEGSPTLMNSENSPVDNPSLYSNWDGPVTIGSTGLTLARYSGSAAMNCFVFNNEVSGVGKLVHDLPGHLIFTGSSTNTLGGLTQSSSGVTHVKDDVHLNITNAVVTIAGGTVAAPSTLILSNNASIVELPSMPERTKRTAYRIGDTSKYGLLKIYDGAVVSNDVTLGLRGYGACYQFGGDFSMKEGRDGNNVIFLGSEGKAYGYLGVDGGVYRHDHWFWLGKYAPGFFVQRGGKVYQGFNNATAPVRIAFSGGNSYGNYTVLGGKAVWGSYAALNFSAFTPTSEDGTGVFTVDGATADVDMSTSFIRSVPSTNAANAVTALVNVGHGGKLKVKYIAVEQVTNKDSPSWSSIKALTPQATKTYLNFNGGIIVTARNGDFFNGNGTDVYRLPTRATVYENGLTIDTDGKNVTWGQPLERPYGYGIQSITVPDSLAAANALLGPTRCIITSAQGGAGADAIMDFDNTNRIVRGMIITSPGFGYEAAPTVKVHGATAVASSAVACGVETVDYDAASFKHGGLVKRGAGALTLTATNTYGGATRVEGGTLAFTHADGLPKAGTIVFAASALAACTDAAPVLTAAAHNGGEIRVTEADTLDAEAFRKLKSVAHFDAPLTVVPTLRVFNSDGREVTGAWRLVLSADGRTLRFGTSNGLKLFVR